MNMKRYARNEKGFTLVELLIVVIILGILAAVAIPQFGDSSAQAREETLSTNVATLRSAVEYYFAQHGEYPGRRTTDGTGLTTGDMAAAATGLIDQLTLYSDGNGKTSPTLDRTNYPYGPYLKKKAVPENPIASSTTVVCVETGTLNLNAAGAGGWRFDVASGRLIADSTGNDSSGTAYETY